MASMPTVLKQLLFINTKHPFFPSGFGLSPASNQTLTLHRYLEAVKFANGQKPNLKDPFFSSKDVWFQLYLSYCSAWAHIFCLEHSFKNYTTSEFLVCLKLLLLYLLLLAVSIISLDVHVGLSKYYEGPDVISYEGHTNASD